MKGTYADESWHGNLWDVHVVLAHINFNQDLDWFFQLLYNLKRNQPNVKEFKASSAIELLEQVDIKIKELIWKTLQDSIIVVQDPKEYMKESGVNLLKDGSLQFIYKDYNYVLDKGHKEFAQFNEILQRHLAKIILNSSPVANINFSIGELPILPRKVNFFSPENILELIDRKNDSRSEIIATIKLSARLCSAFFDLIDPASKRRVIEQSFEFGSDFLVGISEFHRRLLRQAIKNNRFFDKGNTPSVRIISQCFERIGDCLEPPIENDKRPIAGKVEEFDSKESIMVQACDFAAGIARKIYESQSLKGLRERFRYVIFNGSFL